MGITIYDLRTSHNRHPEFGDFVMCQHCGRYMLVNFGEDDCPICGEHTLQWADYGHRQVNLEYFAQTERYMVSTLKTDDLRGCVGKPKSPQTPEAKKTQPERTGNKTVVWHKERLSHQSKHTKKLEKGRRK